MQYLPCTIVSTLCHLAMERKLELSSVGISAMVL